MIVQNRRRQSASKRENQENRANHFPMQKREKIRSSRSFV